MPKLMVYLQSFENALLANANMLPDIPNENTIADMCVSVVGTTIKSNGFFTSQLHLKLQRKILKKLI